MKQSISHFFLLDKAFTSKIRFAKEKEEKAKIALNFVDAILPGFLSLNEEILAQRGEGRHFAGNDVRYKDFFVETNT